jgi:hypothetical protein
MEWIFTQTKVSGLGRLELALETKKKERLTIGSQISDSDICTIVLMDELGLNR